MEKHDYGQGFYLTESVDLAKEWAVCRPNDTNGWVHKYKLDTDGLRILDFHQMGVFAWLAELMKHRDAADSKRYEELKEQLKATGNSVLAECAVKDRIWGIGM